MTLRDRVAFGVMKAGYRLATPDTQALIRSAWRNGKRLAVKEDHQRRLDAVRRVR